MTTIILPETLDVVIRWAECEARNSVRCWLALSHVLLAYYRLEFHDNRFTVANDLLMLSELAQQRGLLLGRLILFIRKWFLSTMLFLIRD